VQTKDSGAQRIEWTGSRRMSGARLFAMPHLRPIRIGAGSLGMEQPDQDLLVSPQHRMLVKGAVAQALFNTPEVLVSAKDLVNKTTITTDIILHEVTYVHLLLPSHQIVWANGVETESFHPASASLASLDDEDRARLLALHPQLETEAHAYGAFARRNLNASEAAILTHEAA
ncbi:MAG: Hint domain-containing protein, partial [Pseudomonadota bacterium]